MDIVDKLKKIANTLDVLGLEMDADDVDGILERIDEKYQPPLDIETLKSEYPKLSEDDVHKWRAETGIELIHQEPSMDEQIRIWKNWQHMSDEQKVISDNKSKELFGMINADHHKQLMHEWGNFQTEINAAKYALNKKHIK